MLLLPLNRGTLSKIKMYKEIKYDFWSNRFRIIILRTRVVSKVMSNFFLHANCEQQMKESVVVDGTSCYVILECIVTSIACIM